MTDAATVRLQVDNCGPEITQDRAFERSIAQRNRSAMRLTSVNALYLCPHRRPPCRRPTHPVPSGMADPARLLRSLRWIGALALAAAACAPGSRGALPGALQRAAMPPLPGTEAAAAAGSADAAAVGPARRVRVVLLDNLISNEVLRGAMVAIDGRPGVTVSSGVGVVTFDSLHPGQHWVQIWHPLLDSIGLAALRLDFPVRVADTSLVVALPTPARLFEQLCGAIRGNAHDGMLMGVVRRSGSDTPLADVEVAAAWRGSDTTYFGSELRERARVRSSPNGQFLICRVPRFTPVELWARAERKQVTRVRLQLGAAVLGAFDLSADERAADTAVVAATEYGSITGRIVTSAGQEMPNVTVQLDRPALRTTTDSIGLFVFPRVVAGLRALDIRAVGFRPSRVGVNVRPGQRVTSAVSIDRNAAMLGTVTVRGTRPPTWDSLGFVERRKRGGGYFLTRESLAGIVDLSTALRMVPGVSGPTSLTRQELQAGRGAGCFPAYVINGVRFGANSSIGPDAFIRAEDVRAIEVYTSKLTTPPEHQRYLDCAVIVIWLRDRQGEIEAAKRSAVR